MNPDVPAFFRTLGSTGLHCHPLGFGCYRIAEGVAEHEASLQNYLDRGGNLIDTSANYTDGQSEKLVGKLLAITPRRKPIVVTKAGYIQGQNMALAQQRLFPEVVKYGEDLWHCIHPDFLETQLSASCQRLQQDHIDIFLLHNPEYFLSHQTHHHALNNQDHQEFYQRIAQAFRFLENQTKKGKIGWYGISSNHYGLPINDPTMTSIQRCLSQAQRITSDHHFRVVQLPLNLYENGCALELNNAGLSAIDFCRREGLGVLINRPLNAFFNNQMIRLADFLPPGQHFPELAKLDFLVRPLREAEQSLVNQFQAPLLSGSDSGFADLILQIVPQVRTAAHWDWVIERYLAPPLQRWLEDCRRNYQGNDFWGKWEEQFFQTIRDVLEKIERHLLLQQQEVSDQIRTLLEKSGYPQSQASLSQIAMNLLLNLDGVSCVLNGMRRKDYVNDALGTTDLPRVDSRSILFEFSQMR